MRANEVISNIKDLGLSKISHPYLAKFYLDEDDIIHTKPHNLTKKYQEEIQPFNNLLKQKICYLNGCFELKTYLGPDYKIYEKFFQEISILVQPYLEIKGLLSPLHGILREKLIKHPPHKEIENLDIKDMDKRYYQDVIDYLQNWENHEVKVLTSNLLDSTQVKYHSKIAFSQYLSHTTGPLSKIKNLTKNLNIVGSYSYIPSDGVNTYDMVCEIKENLQRVSPLDFTVTNFIDFTYPARNQEDLITLWRETLEKELTNFLDQYKEIEETFKKDTKNVIFITPQGFDKSSYPDLDHDLALDILYSYRAPGSTNLLIIPNNLAKYLEVYFNNGSYLLPSTYYKPSENEQNDMLLLSMVERLNNEGGIYEDIELCFKTAKHLMR